VALISQKANSATSAARIFLPNKGPICAALVDKSSLEGNSPGSLP
jgi:hypothetical protein